MCKVWHEISVSWFPISSHFYSFSMILCSSAWSRYMYHNHHHHQFNVHFLPRWIKGMGGCFPTALGRQSTFSNILGDFLFSHRDASISRKFSLVTIRQLSIPGKVGASFWWRDALPHTNQLGLGKRRWNLEDLFSGSWISDSLPYPTPYPTRLPTLPS